MWRSGPFEVQPRKMHEVHFIVLCWEGLKKQGKPDFNPGSKVAARCHVLPMYTVSEPFILHEH